MGIPDPDACYTGRATVVRVCGGDAMTRRACRSFLRALKRWTPSPACLWRVLFPNVPNGGPGGTRASW
jgi:hypothetical protein